MRVDIMMPTADAERTEMKEQKKSKSLEIVEKQRALVVEKIIEDMKRDGLHWSEPYIPSLSPHNPVSGRQPFPPRFRGLHARVHGQPLVHIQPDSR